MEHWSFADDILDFYKGIQTLFCEMHGHCHHLVRTLEVKTRIPHCILGITADWVREEVIAITMQAFHRLCLETVGMSNSLGRFSLHNPNPRENFLPCLLFFGTL
jgi:hypothetical protein